MRKITCWITLSLLFIVFLSNKDALEERYRPQFHFTPEKSWMNNPTGLVCVNGTYHLFYQQNPGDSIFGFTSWGHATSKDLVRWEHHPIAIRSESQPDKEIGFAWAGSAIVDERNVTGLKSGNNPLMLIFYSDQKIGQQLAYSNDEGLTWKKYDKNPVMANDDKNNGRDPKVFWHEAGNKYIMILSREPEEGLPGFSFYSSSNLLDWQYESHLPGFSGSPDMVQLPVIGKDSEKRWVLFDGDGSYCVGDFNGKIFLPESPIRKSDYGSNYHAAQTWSNISKEDERVIQIAWMKGGEYPGMPFEGQMTFPCEIALISEGEDLKLIKKPVKEIEHLHKKQVYSEENKNVIPGLNKNPVRGIKNDCLHIKGTFVLNTINNFGFMIRMNQDNIGTEIRYDATKNTLNCQGMVANLPPEDGKIKLEILIDRTSIEVFANDGKAVFSCCFVPDEKGNQLYLYNTGGELLIEKLDIYSIESMYVEVKK